MLGGGDRQHAGPGAEVEHAARSARFQKPIERDQAAARRPVMAGTECQRGLDLDADAVAPDAPAIVVPEASRRYRPQAG